MKIGFVDYSHEERNRILATLKLLEEHMALDELGVGVVRDAYADKLFPGISTLQTRAKYFVLIPYIFSSAKKQVEKGKIRSGQEFLQWVNEAEDRLVATLKANCPPGENGIIGINAFRRKRSVKIKPSTIYWSGLRTFGIFRGNCNLFAACKVAYETTKRKIEMENQCDGESYDDPTAKDQGSSLFLPIKLEYDYEKEASMDLTQKEAEYLKNCIQTSPATSDSLLAFFVKEQTMKQPDVADFQSIPADQLPESIRRVYFLAKEFSDFIYGAHLRYNVIFSEYNDENMNAKFNEWREEFLSKPFKLKPILDGVVSYSSPLRSFCEEFLDAVRKNDRDAVDNLIVQREIQVKGPRSKLRKPSEYCYNRDNPVHFYKLDFRFDRAIRIVRDIRAGLGGERNV